MDRPKNRNSSITSASVTPSTTSDWPETGIPPKSKRASENGGVREPSAPKNSRPRPTSTPCSATDTMSSMSTEASASGLNAKRYSSGPIGVISTSVVSACTPSDVGLTPSTSAQATSGSATHHTSVAGQLTGFPALWRTTSTNSTTAASPTRSHSVDGMRPPCIMAMVRAPKATNSPWGMKITRVTEKTSTSASAISP